MIPTYVAMSRCSSYSYLLCNPAAKEYSIDTTCKT